MGNVCHTYVGDGCSWSTIAQPYLLWHHWDRIQANQPSCSPAIVPRICGWPFDNASGWVSLSQAFGLTYICGRLYEKGITHASLIATSLCTIAKSPTRLYNHTLQGFSHVDCTRDTTSTICCRWYSTARESISIVGSSNLHKFNCYIDWTDFILHTGLMKSRVWSTCEDLWQTQDET